MVLRGGLIRGRTARVVVGGRRQQDVPPRCFPRRGGPARVFGAAPSAPPGGPTVVARRQLSELPSGRRLNARLRAQEELDALNLRYALYGTSVVLATVAMCYASAPLYKVFCSTTGFGGTTRKLDPEEAEEMMTPVTGGRVVRVSFDAQVADTLPWTFRPAQKDVKIIPGETALAFFTTVNTADHAITGVATYNVQPPQAGQYFNKIQCFCFDEQRLRPNEEVDMPVFFVIDPRFLEDPNLRRVSNITLSYHFFKTGDDFDDDEVEEEEEEEEEEEDEGADKPTPPPRTFGK